jgi:hypothetical protein
MPWMIIGAVLLVAIGIRLLIGGIDRGRVERYIERKGGKLLDASWAPFGPGWFGEKEERIYRVVYQDQDGRRHEAHCKTSMLTGVYLTNDVVVDERESPPSTTAALQEENRRLRDEVERLKKERGE